MDPVSFLTVSRSFLSAMKPVSKVISRIDMVASLLDRYLGITQEFQKCT
uniref:Uncharacterized protein n=1 Tax=Anguilla anguilla TaxID=7936 RepID=A0A0E9W2I7_ANGAN